MLAENHKDFLTFMKGKYPLFHLSNVFFRDVHYAVMAYLEQKGMKNGYTSTESVAEEIIAHLEEQKIFRTIDSRTWLLLYPAFKAISKKKPAAKPAPARPAAAGAAPAARPAAANPGQASPVTPPKPSPAAVPEQKAETPPPGGEQKPNAGNSSS
jgi:hypothetical protein